MRILLYVTILALICAAAALGVLQRYGWQQDEVWTADRVIRLVDESTRQLQPAGRVETFSSLPESRRELNNLTSLLPDTIRFDRGLLADLVTMRETCDRSFMRQPEDARLRKAFDFTAIICGHVTTPPGFFTSSPFIHPLGRSFVLRAFLEAPQLFPRTWLQEHRDYLHASELPRYLADSSGAPAPGISLSDAARRQWVGNEALFLNAGELLIWKETQSDAGPADSHYQRFRISDVNVALRRSGLMLEAVSDTPGCLLQRGGLCVREDRTTRSVRSWALKALSIALFVMIASTLTLGSQWMLVRARARRERVMILQTLAHELRTPVTSLSLTFELLRGEFDRLSGDGQTNYLRMADDLRRLKRLVEGSRDYLATETSQRYEKHRIDLGAFLGQFLSSYDNSVVLRLADEQISVASHPYWLGICLSNLIDNALRHGKQPIGISVIRDGRGVMITVEDSGSFTRKDFLRLRGEFKRGSDSEGSGLGLAIVTETLKKLGHRFEFNESPTRFSVRLEEA
jgi:signal transduction histidine kinase